MPADPQPDAVPTGATASGAAPAVATAGGAHSAPPARLAQKALADLPWEVGIAKPDPALVVDKVTRTFGGLTAVSVDHLEIQRGGITGLIGPNGAGKTTLFNLLTGFDQPNTGTWTFDGRSLGRLSPHQVARLGVVRTFQLTKALSRLTVLQNMLLGAQGQTGESFLKALVPGTWRAQEKANTEKAMDLLRRFKLDAKKDDFAGILSGGQRKLLEMARALMSDPKVVMLDEPMAGVNPALTQSLLGHVKDLREEGMTVVFVEHDMDVVRDISDWVVVMAAGRVIAEGPPESISQNKAVVDAYLGAHHDAPLTNEEEDRILAEAEAAIAREEGVPDRDTPAETLSSDPGREGDPMSEPLFEVDETGEELTRADTAVDGGGELSPAEKAATRPEHVKLAEGALIRADELVAGYVPGVNILRGCDFYLADGELVGIIGPNGAGKSTLLKTLFGLIPVRSGAVTLRGENITSAPAHKLVQLGVGYVPQNNNVFPSLTISENMEMGVYLRPKTFKARFDYVVDLFPLLGERRNGKAGSLSGGERQMVAMGRALMMDPSVLLLDEPSAGLSPAYQDEVFIRCRRINATGVSIIMVEQNARRCLQICDRGYVLDQGRNAYTDKGKALMDDPKVVELYLGTLAKAT